MCKVVVAMSYVLALIPLLLRFIASFVGVSPTQILEENFFLLTCLLCLLASDIPLNITANICNHICVLFYVVFCANITLSSYRMNKKKRL